MKELIAKLKSFSNLNMTNEEMIAKLTDAEKLQISKAITDMQLDDLITKVLDNNS